MEKLRFDFIVKSIEDSKTNLLCITSITDISGHTFAVSEKLQPMKYHEAVTNTETFVKVKSTLTKRHEKRKVWITITPEMEITYVDNSGNMQLNGYLLEEITSETPKLALASGISEESLSKIFENFTVMTKEINKSQHIANLTKTFVIEKFTRKTSNVAQWMTIFEAECARIGIEEDTKKI